MAQKQHGKLKNRHLVTANEGLERGDEDDGCRISGQSGKRIAGRCAGISLVRSAAAAWFFINRVESSESSPLNGTNADAEAAEAEQQQQSMTREPP